MSKDKYYFSHDYNARNDRKISALVGEFKAAGYGIFWCVCEMMHEENGAIELDDITYAAVARDLNEDLDFARNVIEKCVTKFKLFIKKNEKLESARVKKNLSKRLSISEKRATSGKKGAIAKQTAAKAKQNQAKERKGKERKIEERKGEEIKEIIPPTMPVASDFNGLPEIKLGSAIQLLRVTQGTTVTESDIGTLWEVFKVQNLTGKKFYQTEDDVYSHFLNWVKGQKINKDGNKFQGSNTGVGEKSGTSAERNKKGRTW